MVYRLERTELGDEWDAFVKSSPNGTLFSYSKYLEATGRDVGVWFCTKGNQIKAAFVGIEMGNQLVLDDFVVYSGLMHQAAEPTQNVSQIRSERFAVAQVVAKTLANHYWRMAFALHPSIVDVRPWLWVNYELDRLKHYHVDVRYTSHYEFPEDDSDYADEWMLGEMSQSRRQEIQYARREGVVTKQDYNINKFMALYGATFERQGKEVSKVKLQRMARLLGDLGLWGLARMYSAYTADGLTGSMAVFGIDERRAYWLWGANNPDLRDSHCGSACVWDAMMDLRRDGIREVDFEGVNSPARGWFKLSFGGSLLPYYELRYS